MSASGKCKSASTTCCNLFNTRIREGIKRCNECDFAQRAVVFYFLTLFTSRCFLAGLSRKWNPPLADCVLGVSSAAGGVIIKTTKGPGKGEGRVQRPDRHRILAHLKTLAKWIHKLRPFPLGDPMAKMKLMPIRNGLKIERAISPAERRRIWV